MGKGTLRVSLLRFSTVLGLAVCTSGCATASQSDDDPTIDAGKNADGETDPDPADAGRPADSSPPGTPDARPADAAPPGTPDADIPAPTEPNLIDDLNDGNDLIRNVGGRAGVWFTYHDDTVGGVQTPGEDFLPSMPGADGAGFAARTTGHGFAEWGAGIGFDLKTPNGASTKGKYDGSAYTGFSFKAKGTAPIRVSVQIAAVLETSLGGTCVPSTTPGLECDDVHGKAITLTTSWQQIQVPFSQLAQEGWGKPATFDKTTMTAIHFQTLPGATFDVSIDDIRFF